MREIVRAVAKSAGGTFAGLLLGAAATKILAVMIGPAGMGLVSIMRQFHQALTMICSLNGQNAIVQGIVSRNTDQRPAYTAAVFWLLISWVLIFSILLVAFANPLGRILFAGTTTNQAQLIYVMIIPGTLAASASYLAGIINANRGIGVLAMGPAIAGVAWVILAYPVGILFHRGHPVAFVALLAVISGATFIFYLERCLADGWLRGFKVAIQRALDLQAIRHFLVLATSSMLTGLIGIVTLLALRVIISKHMGIEAAAYFDTAWTLSMMYVTILLSSFTTYYLPTLAAIPNKRQISPFVNKILRFSLIAGVPVITSIISLKPFIISTLYSKEFYQALYVIEWMLVGDFIKIISFVFGMTVLAFPNMRIFILFDILWYFLFFLFSYTSVVFLNRLDLIGLAFTACYALAMIGFAVYVWRAHDVRLSGRMIATASIGFALVLIASVLCWGDQHILWHKSLIILFSSLAYSSFVLTKSEREYLIKSTIGIVQKFKKKISSRQR